jgi:hypothetical protein
MSDEIVTEPPAGKLLLLARLQAEVAERRRLLAEHGISLADLITKEEEF